MWDYKEIARGTKRDMLLKRCVKGGERREERREERALKHDETKTVYERKGSKLITNRKENGNV